MAKQDPLNINNNLTWISKGRVKKGSKETESLSLTPG